MMVIVAISRMSRRLGVGIGTLLQGAPAEKTYS